MDTDRNIDPGLAVDLREHIDLKRSHDALKELGDSAMVTGERVRSAQEIIKTLEAAIPVEKRPPDPPAAVLRRKYYVTPGGKRDRRRRGKAQRQARQIQQRMARAA